MKNLVVSIETLVLWYHLVVKAVRLMTLGFQGHKWNLLALSQGYPWFFLVMLTLFPFEGLFCRTGLLLLLEGVVSLTHFLAFLLGRTFRFSSFLGEKKDINCDAAACKAMVNSELGMEIV